MAEDGTAEMNVTTDSGTLQNRGNWRLDGKRVIVMLLRANNRSINENVAFSV